MKLVELPRLPGTDPTRSVWVNSDAIAMLKPAAWQPDPKKPTQWIYGTDVILISGFEIRTRWSMSQLLEALKE